MNAAAPMAACRRAADARLPLAPKTRERFLISGPTQSDHMRGFVLHGMSTPLPADASADMKAGYAEARNCFISIALSVDAIALVRT